MKKPVQYLTIAALGLALLTGCKKTEPTPTALASVGTNTSASTIDQASLTKDIYVSGLSGNVYEVKVAFKGSSPYTGDVEVYLKAPSGKILQLMADESRQADATNDAYPAINVTFTDAASVSIADWTSVSTASLTGTFRPRGSVANTSGGFSNTGTITSFAGFKGDTPNGTWTLYIYDDASSDLTTYTSWELFLSTVN